MNIPKTSTLALGLATCAVVVAPAAHASPIIHTDAASLHAALGESHVESFETMGPGPVGSLTFGGAMTADVSTSGVQENAVLTNADGFGAVAMGGTGKFWKLRAGITTIDLGAPWHAFGFWYSDLEGATLIVTPGGHAGVSLDDNNAHTNHFFGLSSDQAFSSVTIAWSVSNGDGIGIDDIVVGRMNVPGPGSAILAAIALLGIIPRRMR
jgi:hypothetical protein